jgi:hypothetical protein
MRIRPESRDSINGSPGQGDVLLELGIREQSWVISGNKGIEIVLGIEILLYLSILLFLFQNSPTPHPPVLKNSIPLGRKRMDAPPVERTQRVSGGQIPPQS